jgi:hypothetical protein
MNDRWEIRGVVHKEEAGLTSHSGVFILETPEKGSHIILAIGEHDQSNTTREYLRMYQSSSKEPGQDFKFMDWEIGQQVVLAHNASKHTRQQAQEFVEYNKSRPVLTFYHSTRNSGNVGGMELTVTSEGSLYTVNIGTEKRLMGEHTDEENTRFLKDLEATNDLGELGSLVDIALEGKEVDLDMTVEATIKETQNSNKLAFKFVAKERVERT